jgi:hypothetical protein
MLLRLVIFLLSFCAILPILGLKMDAALFAGR